MTSKAMRELNKKKKALEGPIKFYTTTKPKSIVDLPPRHECNCDLSSEVANLRRKVIDIVAQVSAIKSDLGRVTLHLNMVSGQLADMYPPYRHGIKHKHKP